MSGIIVRPGLGVEGEECIGISRKSVKRFDAHSLTAPTAKKRKVSTKNKLRFRPVESRS